MRSKKKKFRGCDFKVVRGGMRALGCALNTTFRSPSAKPFIMSSSSNNTVAMPQASDSSDPASNLPGSSCHQCKSRRAKPDLVFCTNILDKKSKSCRKKYCEHCLRKFYSEDAPTAGDERGCWSCPSCRGLCCCAACRRRQEKLIKKSGGTLPRGMIPLPPKNGVKRKASSSPVESDDG